MKKKKKKQFSGKNQVSQGCEIFFAQTTVASQVEEKNPIWRSDVEVFLFFIHVEEELFQHDITFF